MEPGTLKNTGLWCLLIFCGFISAAIVYISIISVWVGFHFMPRNGFWIPIVAGTVVMTMIFFIFERLIRFFLNQMKERDIIVPL